MANDALTESLEKQTAIKLLFNNSEMNSLVSITYQSVQATANLSALGRIEATVIRGTTSHVIEFSELPLIIQQVQAFIGKSDSNIYSFENRHSILNGGLNLQYRTNNLENIINEEDAQIGVYRVKPKSFQRVPPFNIIKMSLDETHGKIAVQLFLGVVLVSENGGITANNQPELYTYRANCKEIVQGLLLDGKTGKLVDIEDAGTDSTGKFSTRNLLNTVNETTLSPDGTVVNPIPFAPGQT